MIAIKNSVVGSWQLIKYEELPVDGSPATHPLRDRPKGYIIYSADGFMAALLLSADEKYNAHPIAYAGPYSVDEEHQTIHQHADVSLLSEWPGETQNRKVRMEGDRLILSTAEPAILFGRRANAVITWQRAGG